jgi:hypothetical protein
VFVGEKINSVTWLGYSDATFKIDCDVIYFSYWPIYLDLYKDNPSDWALLKQMAIDLQNIGATHAGISCYYYYNLTKPETLADISSKILELRKLNLNFTITESSKWLMESNMKAVNRVQYGFNGGGAGKFMVGETITSGAKTAVITIVVDAGATGKIVLNGSIFSNGNHIAGSGGKTATISTNPNYNIPIPDGAAHANGLDLRFFDTPGWTFDINSIDLQYGAALDPSYCGTIWTNYLEYLQNALEIFGFTYNDFFFFDFEMWFQPQIWAITPSVWANFGGPPTAFPPMVANSIRCGKSPISNPLNDQNISFDNYKYHWKQRGTELTNVIKNHAPLSHILHYDEQTIYVYNENIANSYMPPGTGDYTCPGFYHLKDTDALYARLHDGGSDYNGAMAAISFSYSSTPSGDPTGQSIRGKYVRFDSSYSRIAGKMFRESGFIGFYEWPGPSIIPDPLLFVDYEDFINYYKEHLIAFFDGYNND